MNTRTLRLALCVGLASTFSLTAAAAPGKMAKLDLNGDTYVDKTEFLSAADQKFTNMDTDANGLVTADERIAFHKAKREEIAQRRFERDDADGDGTVTQQEFDDARAERSQKREAARAERREQRQALDASPVDREERRGKRERQNPDSNGDGVVDVAEHTAAAENAFTRMDKNGDGVLSSDELKRKKRRGGRKHHRSGR